MSLRLDNKDLSFTKDVPFIETVVGNKFHVPSYCRVTYNSLVFPFITTYELFRTKTSSPFSYIKGDVSRFLHMDIKPHS